MAIILPLYLVVIGTSIWVGFDAKSIGARKGLIRGLADIGPIGWFFGCLLIWIIAFPLYLAKRSEIKVAAAAASPTRAGHMASSRVAVSTGGHEMVETWAPVGAHSVGAGAVRDCPWCAETIKAAAKICRYCGRDVEPLAAPAIEPAPPPSRQNSFDIMRAAYPRSFDAVWQEVQIYPFLRTYLIEPWPLWATDAVRSACEAVNRGNPVAKAVRVAFSRQG